MAYNVLEFGKKKERQEKQQAKKSDRVNVAGSTVNSWNFETELKIETLTAILNFFIGCLRKRDSLCMEISRTAKKRSSKLLV